MITTFMLLTNKEHISLPNASVAIIELFCELYILLTLIQIS